VLRPTRVQRSYRPGAVVALLVGGAVAGAAVTALAMQAL
jgi:hypothetical protein